MKPLRYIILGYGVLCGLFYGYQQYFYFLPKKVDPETQYRFPEELDYTSSKLPFDSATMIDVIKFLPKDSATKGVVLFFHGNKDNVKHYSRYAPYFTSLGYECWMPDYPGYGRSTGELTVETLNSLAVQLYKMARAKHEKSGIIIYGKSLGSGIAAYLASVRDCRALVLETPYYNLTSLTGNYLFFMPVKFLVKFKITTNEYFENITAPITIIHGGKDEQIPLSNASGLLKLMKPEDAFYIVPGGTHNSLPDYPLYHAVIDSVLNH